DQAGLVEAYQQRDEDLGPGAVLAPAVEAVVDGLPGAVPLRKVAPRGAGVEMPKDAVDDEAVKAPGMPRAVARVTVGEKGGDAFPLGIGEFVAMHREPPFGSPRLARGGQ